MRLVILCYILDKWCLRDEKPDKVTRVAAINTVKRWIPDVQPMDSMIREFAMQLLRRLQSRPKTADKAAEAHVNGDGDHDRDENMDSEEDGQLPMEDIIQTPYLSEQLELPVNNAQILQHVELIFSLSTKVPEFLDEYVLIPDYMQFFLVT